MCTGPFRDGRKVYPVDEVSGGLVLSYFLEGSFGHLLPALVEYARVGERPFDLPDTAIAEPDGEISVADLREGAVSDLVGLDGLAERFLVIKTEVPVAVRGLERVELAVLEFRNFQIDVMFGSVGLRHKLVDGLDGLPIQFPEGRVRGIHTVQIDDVAVEQGDDDIVGCCSDFFQDERGILLVIVSSRINRHDGLVPKAWPGWTG